MAKFSGVENNKSRPYITMSNVRRLHILEIPKEEVQPLEVALHLAKNCRFNGLLKGWYSTAEHCILGLHKCPTVELKREFLVHDAGELVTGDFPAPVKWMFPELKVICDNIQSKFNLAFLGKADFDPLIHEIDHRLCATEQRTLRNQPEDEWIAEPYEDVHFFQWPWEEAYNHWVHCFRELFPEWNV